MQIFYKKQPVQIEVEKILSAADIPAEYEQRERSRFEGRQLLGSALPPLDYGAYDLTFNLAKEIAVGVIASAVWDAIKAIYHYLKTSTDLYEQTLVIQTDQYWENKKANIFFVFSTKLEERELNEGIKKIPELRTKMLELLQLADVSSDFGFRYQIGRWWLEKPYHERMEKFYQRKLFWFLFGCLSGLIAIILVFHFI